mmetsp:Transcript_12725/g.40062  ORF Transcript_12725/g.40062 Transcript_12725/m.40062 type:complete len:245 (-) Transcript_12725:162-896(-)
MGRTASGRMAAMAAGCQHSASRRVQRSALARARRARAVACPSCGASCRRRLRMYCAHSSHRTHALGSARPMARWRTRSLRSPVALSTPRPRRTRTQRSRAPSRRAWCSSTQQLTRHHLPSLRAPRASTRPLCARAQIGRSSRFRRLWPPRRGTGRSRTPPPTRCGASWRLLSCSSRRDRSTVSTCPRGQHGAYELRCYNAWPRIEARTPIGSSSRLTGALLPCRALLQRRRPSMRPRRAAQPSR